MAGSGGEGAFGVRLPLESSVAIDEISTLLPVVLARMCSVVVLLCGWCKMRGTRRVQDLRVQVSNAGLGLGLPIFEGDRTITFFLNTMLF